MTFPIDIHIGIITIPSHAIFELLAFFVGYRYYIYLKLKSKSVPLEDDKAMWIIVGMATGALIGSRLIAGLENPFFFLHPTTWLYYIGNQTILGGVAGGILGVELMKKVLKIKRKTGDLFVYPLILGIIIGRTGCFLKGVSDGTAGLPCDYFWCFNQGDGIARHPTSLYEIIFLIFLWIIIKRVEKQDLLREGGLFGIFILGYALFRLLVEFIKPTNPLWIYLSSIQLVSLVLVIYYSVYIIKFKNHGST